MTIVLRVNRSGAAGHLFRRVFQDPVGLTWHMSSKRQACSQSELVIDLDATTVADTWPFFTVVQNSTPSFDPRNSGVSLEPNSIGKKGFV